VEASSCHASNESGGPSYPEGWRPLFVIPVFYLPLPTGSEQPVPAGRAGQGVSTTQQGDLPFLNPATPEFLGIVHSRSEPRTVEPLWILVTFYSGTVVAAQTY
jgi:hypothetical protein